MSDSSAPEVDRHLLPFDLFKSIYNFNLNVVGVEPPRPPAPLSVKTGEWLVDALKEEAAELDDAVFEDDLIAQIDALADSIIFALGGLYRIGLNPHQARQVLAVVMEANWKKKAGIAVAHRGHEGVPDAGKPGGWVGPEAHIAMIVHPKTQKQETTE